ncbi:MAG: hypothetical protein H5T69_05960 [Chloroflexi bacterium]|nr:hypothetical protein [Chloroflexota bacterium]
MHLVPEYAQIAVGDEIDVDVMIDDAEDLFGIEFDLLFDPVILQVVDIDPDRAGIQMAPGDFPYPDFVAENRVDNLYGRISYACTQMAPREPVSGSGRALTVRFRATNVGSTFLDFEDLIAAGQDHGLDADFAPGEIVVVAQEGPSPTPTSAQTIPPQPTTAVATRTFTPSPSPTNTAPAPSATSLAQVPTPTASRTSPPTATSATDTYPAPEATTPAIPPTFTPPATAGPSMPTFTPGPKRTPSEALPGAPTRASETSAPQSAALPTSTASPGATSTDSTSPTAESPAPVENRPTTEGPASAETQPPQHVSPTAAEMAALVSTPGGQPRERQAERSDRPLLPQEIFICLSVGLVLLAALLIFYLTQRHRRVRSL